MSPFLYLELQRFVKDAFLYDHNLVVEEFNLYQLLPHRMQTEVIETLDTFKSFYEKFSTFFKPCEIGFRNEIVIQCFTREFPPGEEIVSYGKKFREIFFIMEGKVDLKKGKETFMQLIDGNIFGDYQVLFGLTTNIIYEVAHRDDVEIDPENPLQNINSKFMGVEAGVVEELCELYPKTAENLKMRSLEKRAVYLYYMGEPSSTIRRQIKQNQNNERSSRSLKSHINWQPITEESPICDLIKVIPSEEMTNPVFLKEEGVEEEDDEATNEIKEITDNCVDLMTKVNKVLFDIIADNRKMKEDLAEGHKLRA